MFVGETLKGFTLEAEFWVLLKIQSKRTSRCKTNFLDNIYSILT